MTIRITALAGAALILFVTFMLLRRNQLREKYAVLWIVVSICGFALAAFPGVLFVVSEFLGFTAPASLFYCLMGALLLLISMQFSLEMGSLEEENRRLAEESALNELTMERLQRRITALEASEAESRKGTSHG